MAGDERADVEVSGLTDDVDNDFLQLYFENRRSGGGPIKSVARNGPTAHLTFFDPGDAEAVLAKGDHRLHQVTVQVRRPPPWDPRKVALCGLDPDTDDDLLELYVEAVSGCNDVTVVRSADKTNALLSFQQELTDGDFQNLLTRVEEKRLHRRSISARRVRASSDILVENVGTPMLVELLEMYFESKRSGGGPVRSVTVLRENAAVVSFCDWNVVDRVLSQSHNLQNRQLSVSCYYPDLMGSPNSDLTQEGNMEEEPTTTPVAMQQNHSQAGSGGVTADTRVTAGPEGVTAGSGVTPSIPGPDDMMVEVTVCHPVGEVKDPAHYGGSDIPHTRPDAPQSTPHVQAHRSNEQAAPRTQLSPNTDNGGHLFLGDGRSSATCGHDGIGVLTNVAPNSVQEAEVVMEEAELLFMQRYHHDLLAGMDAVTIFPLEDREKFGFKVVGNPFACKTAVELLQHVVSSLSSRAVTLEYPWVSHFLMESEGQRSLRDLEEQHQCVIDTSQISWKDLGCVYADPWGFVLETAASETSAVQPMVTNDPLLQADLEGIKRFASLLNKDDDPSNVPSAEGLTTVGGSKIGGEDLEEDLNSDVPSNGSNPTTAGVKDEELDQVCQMSRKEYQEQQLDEEAQLLLAIQRSMDSREVSIQEEDDEELQRALEMSLLQSEDSEESLQRALEMSIREQRSPVYGQPMRVLEQRSPVYGEPMSMQEQRSHFYREPMSVLEDLKSFKGVKAPVESAQVRVLAKDETSIVVAIAALRKAITSKLNMVSWDAMEGGKNVGHILEALEMKHKVKISKQGRELQIQGFLQGPSRCRQEMSEILRALQVRDLKRGQERDQKRGQERDQKRGQDGGQDKAEAMNLDIEGGVEIIDLPQTSQEYQRVVQQFLKTLQDKSIEVIQVQKVHNPLLYNQYKLKKLRMVMTDPNIPAERVLYHGTSEDSAKEICHSGFNRSFSGKNAAFYGQGVYFAVESEVSTRDIYSPPNKEGKKFVFAALVLTGEYTQGNVNMKTPPVIRGTDKAGVPRRYDSLVNNEKDPIFFVIFNDTQAYPEYLITCQKRKDTAK